MVTTEIITWDGRTINDLLDLVKKNKPEADFDIIQRAYIFAKKAHQGQFRKSGDPYMCHPLSTAMMLAELKMDEQSIAAALLHDVPEDTSCTLKEIRKEFGKEIATLIEGITKVGKVRYRGMERYIDNLRHMFVAMAKDIRVMLIKFADRIHNLRTLNALPPEKRRRIALESLEIYAPIANRLGIGEIKGLLEDLAFPYVYPEEHEWLVKNFSLEMKEKVELINKFSKYIEKELREHNIPILNIHGRTKHLFSLYQKLKHNERDIVKIYDLVALRIIVPSVAKCYEALGVIHELCKPLKGRIKDYIAQPKPNGYQSLHTTVFCPPKFAKDDVYGQIVEIQIRTPQMHFEAEFGVAAHWQYKEDLPPKKIHKERQNNWVNQVVELQKMMHSGEQLLEALKVDVFQNSIFVFTPMGDVIELPEEATPVDFAYKIHTDLGNHCSGSKINDQIGNLNCHLKSGDVVEVISDPQRKGPSEDWLQFVKTNSARAHIRQALNRQRRNFLTNLISRN